MEKEVTGSDTSSLGFRKEELEETCLCPNWKAGECLLRGLEAGARVRAGDGYLIITFSVGLLGREPRRQVPAKQEGE